MIGKTLGLYLARHFLQYIIFTFLLFFALIMFVDLIELSRKLSKKDDVDFISMFLVSFFRAPAFAENVLPFAVLFGAALSLTLLNKRLELVVARASGVSVWQFMLPLVLVAAAVGVFATTIYSPLALQGLIASKTSEAIIYGKPQSQTAQKSKNFWIRLAEKDGEVVLRAKVSQNYGTLLTGVTAYRFQADGELKQRIDANRARFKTHAEQNYFELLNSDVIVTGQQVETVKSYKLPVLITKSELQAKHKSVDDSSIWELPAEIESAERSGKNKLPIVTRFYSLASQPLLFVSMVLLAGTISLTFTRFGLNKKVILGGILAGFVLYVLTKLVITFGSNGLVPPFIATWTPALIATLICMTVLLYQEDG